MTNDDKGIHVRFMLIDLIIDPCKLTAMSQLPFTFNVIVAGDKMNNHKQYTFVKECHIFIE